MLSAAHKHLSNQAVALISSKSERCVCELCALNGTEHGGVTEFGKGQALFLLLEWKEESFIFGRNKILNSISSAHFYALLVCCILRGFQWFVFDGLSCSSVNEEVIDRVQYELY